MGCLSVPYLPMAMHDDIRSGSHARPAPTMFVFHDTFRSITVHPYNLGTCNFGIASIISQPEDKFLVLYQHPSGDGTGFVLTCTKREGRYVYDLETTVPFGSRNRNKKYNKSSGRKIALQDIAITDVDFGIISHEIPCIEAFRLAYFCNDEAFATLLAEK